MALEVGETAEPAAPRASIGHGAEAERPLRHILGLLLVAIAGLGGLTALNRSYAPEMYSSSGPAEIAEALASGKNYALFDLNVNIRAIRDKHIATLPAAPKLAVLGASHWQEAHADVLPFDNAYNAHVHRDYYEDMLAVVGMFVEHDKLPGRLVIAMRDNLFTPVAERRDHLWLPGIPYYRTMANRLGLVPHPIHATLPAQRWREQISAPMLFANIARWHNATERPHASSLRYFTSLDTLLPDGSIVWSRDHRAQFTQARARKMAREHAESIAKLPPPIDPKGVKAIDTLLAFLVGRGVEVTLVHPPFNPVFYDLVQDTPYSKGLQRIEALTRQLARKHGLAVIGSFNPQDVGCTADMFIDAEHANPNCLQRVFAQLDPNLARTAPVEVAGSTYEYDLGTFKGAVVVKSPASSLELASQQRAIAENARHRTDPTLAQLANVVAAHAANPAEPPSTQSADATPLAKAGVWRVRRKAVTRTAAVDGDRARHRRDVPAMVWPGDAPVAARQRRTGRASG